MTAPRDWRRVLCWFGLHRWQAPRWWTGVPHPNYTSTVTHEWKRRCVRCGTLGTAYLKSGRGG